MADGAVYNVADTVNHFHPEGGILVDFDVGGLLGDELRLGGHHRAAGRRLRHFVLSAFAAVLAFNGRQKHVLNKALDERGFPRADRSDDTDVDIPARSFGDVPVYG